jgi:hypothetical protein
MRRADARATTLVVSLALTTLACTGTAAVAPITDPIPARQAGFMLADVADDVGLTFAHGAFHWGVAPDPAAMMGSGLCWLDVDRDGWMDLFVVNDYAQVETQRWMAQGGLPRSALFHNDRGRFVDASRDSGADLAVRGQGCVAADLDRDGWTDLYVTSSTGGTLLWNDHDGTFTDGTAQAGVEAFGWRTGAAVGDVNGDGWPDLFVAGYTDLNVPNPTATQGFPATYAGVRDLLYLSDGRAPTGRVSFREVGREVGLEDALPEHALGATFADLDRDGDLDLYVAHDLDPNRLYDHVPWPGGVAADPAGLGFRFEEIAARAGVADPNAGMGVAAADVDGDGRPDLFVSNARGQVHAMYQGRPPVATDPTFDDVRGSIGVDLGGSTGWGASWGDLDRDTDLDLAVVSGEIPVRDLAADAQPMLVLADLLAQGEPMRFQDVGARVGLDAIGPLLARGSAMADFDNDGDLDLAVNQLGGPLLLLRNETGGGHWLEIAFASFAPGATVTARLPDGTVLSREVHAGSSYLSSEDPRVHLGLGDAGTLDELRIGWPDGSETVMQDVQADRLLTVEEAG